MMLNRKIYIPVLAVLAMVFSFSEGFAMSDAAYTTPDSWSKHYTPNGVKASSGTINLGDTATLTMGLTTRYQLKTTAYNSDSDLYQYLRGRLGDMALGDGKVDINFNMRVGGDFVRPLGQYEFDMFYDSLDVERGPSDAAYRLYTATVVFDNVVKNAKFTLGRYYLDYTDTLKLDGALINYGNDKYKGYIFYGLPVSFYTSLNTQAAGGGIDLNFDSGTRLRIDGKYLIEDSNTDTDTYIIKARLDQKIKLGAVGSMNLHALGTVMNEVFFAEAGLLGTIYPSQTTFTAKVKGQFNSNTQYVNPVVSDYDLVLGHQEPYVMFNAKIYQGIMQYVAVGASVEGKFNQIQSYGQRDYIRVGGNVDFFGFIPNNYLSFTVDWFDVDEYGRQVDNSQVYFGGRMTQVITQQLELWLGASLLNYRTWFQQIDFLPEEAPIYYQNKKLDDFVYVAYVGATYSPYEWLNIQADYMFESSELIMSEDNDNYQAHYVELWLNFLF